MSETSDITTLLRIFRHARPYAAHVIAIFLIACLGVPLALLGPVPLMIVVDSVIGSEPAPGALKAMLPGSLFESPESIMIVVVGMVIGIAALTQLQSLCAGWLKAYTGEKMTLGFKSQLLGHAQRLSLSYHDTKGTSDAVYRVQYDTQALQRVMIKLLPAFVKSVFTVIGMLVVTMSLDSTLALIALTVSPVLLILTRIYRVKLRSQWRDVKKIESDTLSIAQEVMSALRIVKAFGQEDRESERFRKKSRKGLRARLNVVVLENAFSFLTTITIAIGTAMALYVGVKHVQSGLISLGQLLLIMSYLAQLYSPLKAMGQQITQVQGALASMERAYALLDEIPEVQETDDAITLERARGDIEFSNVFFSYDDTTPCLSDITFEIPARSRVGIVGQTGAGKSTLINMILRLYDPQSGSISLDGRNIRDYSLKDYRDQFGMVLQDTILLSTTIAENIAYSRPDASMDDIISAAKSANVHEDILQFPGGYDTQVGERGMKLSGGQRQRLSIARAFLKGSPILILDEPTSAVDSETESQIIDAMNLLMSDKTTLMIAHRLSTLDSCDLILELDAGKLRDVRSHVLAAS